MVVQIRKVAVAGGLIAIAHTGWTAEPGDLAAKAAAWVDQSLEELRIDSVDGIDRNEARIIADWRILPVVASSKGRKIMSYTEPVSDGVNWRIDVGSESAPGESAAFGPLFISKISGRQFGKGWGNHFGGPITDLGAATCFINDNGSTGTASVTLKRLTQQGDFAAKAVLIECVGRAVARLNAASNGVLQKIEQTDIDLVEGHAIVEFAKPGDPNRSWTAQITLRPKTPPN